MVTLSSSKLTIMLLFIFFSNIFDLPFKLVSFLRYYSCHLAPSVFWNNMLNTYFPVTFLISLFLSSYFCLILNINLLYFNRWWSYTILNMIHVLCYGFFNAETKYCFIIYPKSYAVFQKFSILIVLIYMYL